MRPSFKETYCHEKAFSFFAIWIKQSGSSQPASYACDFERLRTSAEMTTIPYVAVSTGDLPHSQRYLASCLWKVPSKGVFHIVTMLMFGIISVGTLELFGRIAETRVPDMGQDDTIAMSTAAASTIDACLGNVNSQQPLYLVYFGGYTQTLLNNVVMPAHFDRPAKWYTLALASGIIGFKAVTLANDVRHAFAAPWYCLQLIGTGTGQMVTIFQVAIRGVMMAGKMMVADEKVASSNWYILIGYGFVTVPYIPLILVTLIVDFLPGFVIFVPIVLLLFILAIATYVAGYCLLLGKENPDGFEDVSAVLSLMASPFAVLLKFIGEAMARFYAGEGWWMAVYRTWAERTLPSYLSHLSQTSQHATAAIAFYL